MNSRDSSEAQISRRTTLGVLATAPTIALAGCQTVLGNTDGDNLSVDIVGGPDDRCALESVTPIRYTDPPYAPRDPALRLELSLTCAATGVVWVSWQTNGGDTTIEHRAEVDTESGPSRITASPDSLPATVGLEVECKNGPNDDVQLEVREVGDDA